MEALKDLIIEALDEIFSPSAIVLRNDSRIRSLEGLPLYKEVLKGTLGEDKKNLPLIREDGVLFEVDPTEGQKTGFFLDQRENRTLLREFVSGGRGLDLFSYSGGWAMHLAQGGAQVVCVDESPRALDMARRNAALNNIQDGVEFVRADVFDFLKNQRSAPEGGGGNYDFIVLDPPAFVKSSKKIMEAVKAYRTLNEACMRLLKPGGVLATSSCSYHMGRELFIDMLRDAAVRAGRSTRLLALRSQGRDHPVLLSMPETEYLKCAFLVMDP